MAYSINFTDPNKTPITVEDGTTDTTTSLSIPGRNTANYGTVIGQNFIQLLENFSNPTAPLNPVAGQLWYDTSVGVSTLKIYDGTSWVNAGGIKKGDIEPDVSSAIAGDLWSDTDNNQLYLFTGTGWILVGPEFSDGLLTGTKPTVLVGTDDINYTVLTFEVQGEVLAIYSTKGFTPKSTIAGFTAINAGVNLSTRTLLNASPKYYGISEKAEALVIGGEPVQASNFLRSDITSTTTSPIVIRNNEGLQVGQDGLVTFAVEGTSGIISNLTSGSSIDIRINNLGVSKNVIRVDSTEKVGINNPSPIEALDVTGNIQSSGAVIVNSTADSSSTGTGSLTVKGGLGVAKKLYVGTDLNVTGDINSANILPQANNTSTLGSASLKYANVYATTFTGNLTGNVTGTVSGRSGSTNKLATATTFEVQGDVSSNQITFDGQQGGTNKIFTSTISNAFIANKTDVSTSNIDDEFIINRTSGTPGVYKITQRNLLNSVTGVSPVGVVSPFAGDTSPSGWLLCDGTEVKISDFLTLFQTIGYKYKDQSLVTSGFFAVPDLRGRQPLGADNMGGTSSGRVTNVNADVIGNSGGNENKNIQVENLPEHEHDLRGPSGDQYYVIRDIQGVPTDPEGIQYDAPTGSQAGQAYPTSGGILTNDAVGEPLDVMQPFTTMNYIIYTGVGG
jgi:microcystin-dependent protein